MTAQHNDILESSDPNKQPDAELATHVSMRESDKQKFFHHQGVDLKNKSVVIDINHRGIVKQKSFIGQTMQVAPKFSNVDHSSAMRQNEEMASVKLMREMSL